MRMLIGYKTHVLVICCNHSQLGYSVALAVARLHLQKLFRRLDIFSLQRLVFFALKSMNVLARWNVEEMKGWGWFLAVKLLLIIYFFGFIIRVCVLLWLFVVSCISLYLLLLLFINIIIIRQLYQASFEGLFVGSPLQKHDIVKIKFFLATLTQ